MDYRLKRNKDFQFLFNRGNRSQTSNLILIYHKSRELKVGYSVSKKHGKSVVRNRIKRLLRASFNNLFKSVDPCYMIIFLPRVKDSYGYDVFLKDMKYLLEKEGIIRK
ncbi:MAG: ribonuclease P protein component [Clostridia bacterium]|nr:ribonuclease P protein component [Clostridia bacterium]